MPPSALGCRRAVAMANPVHLTPTDIRRLFEFLNDELAGEGAEGELYLFGGAVMCLVMEARHATRVVDAFFRPTAIVREAAARVADKAGVPRSWLNDGVKAFLSPRGDFDAYLELSHLRVLVAIPEYLLAMKCTAMRLGEEFQDLEDIRFLLRYLNITEVDEALQIVMRYFDEAQVLPKTRFALEEILSG
jgi:hypothetical protein